MKSEPVPTAGNTNNIPATYARRLINYLRWATMESVGNAGSTRGLCSNVADDPSGLSADEIMYRWETNGHKNLVCADVKRLYRYAAGKSLRDFYVSNWTKDVRDGLFVAEEFICSGGMDIEEFIGVFKRYPDPWLLRRLWTERVAASSKEATIDAAFARMGKDKNYLKESSTTKPSAEATPSPKETTTAKVAEACRNEFKLRHGYFCELPKNHVGEHEAACPNPAFSQRWPQEATPSPATKDPPELGTCDTTMELCVGEHDGTKLHPRYNTCGNWKPVAPSPTREEMITQIADKYFPIGLWE